MAEDLPDLVKEELPLYTKDMAIANFAKDLCAAHLKVVKAYKEALETEQDRIVPQVEDENDPIACQTYNDNTKLFDSRIQALSEHATYVTHKAFGFQTISQQSATLPLELEKIPRLCVELKQAATNAVTQFNAYQTQIFKKTNQAIDTHTSQTVPSLSRDETITAINNALEHIQNNFGQLHEALVEDKSMRSVAIEQIEGTTSGPKHTAF